MCDMSTLSKYKNRPSPPRPANDSPCRDKVFIGNDGMYWKSTQISNGTYRWVKTKSSVSRKSPAMKKSKSPAMKKSKSLRKSSAGTTKKSKLSDKTVSVTLSYQHTNDDIKYRPTKKELYDFYVNKGAFEEAKNLLTGFYYRDEGENGELQKSMHNFKSSKSGIVTFKVPSRYSNELIKHVVERTKPGPDGSWGGPPGKHMVYGENDIEHGVIEFKNIKIY